MDTITKEFVDEAMAVITGKLNVTSDKDFDNGRILIRFHAAGSRDTMFVYCENREIAYISSKDWKSVWTKWVIEPSKMDSKLGKALAEELQKDFSIDWFGGRL